MIDEPVAELVSFFRRDYLPKCFLDFYRFFYIIHKSDSV